MPFWKSKKDDQESDVSSSSSEFKGGQSLPTLAGKKYLPQPRGPHSVGFIDLITDGVPPKKGSFMRILYPTKEQCLQEHERWPVWSEDAYLSGMLTFMKSVLARWPSWAPKSEYHHIDRMAKITPYIPELGFPYLFRSIVGQVYAPIIEAAEPDKSRKWPLIVFSHGLGCSRTTYSRICYDLASYGFIVAAVEHREGSACASYYYKEAPLMTEWYIDHLPVAEGEDEYAIRNKQCRDRVHEVSLALTLMRDITQRKYPYNMGQFNHDFRFDHLADVLDADKPVLAGHSFGGATTVLAMAKDPRFKFGLALDAWLFPLRDEDLSGIKKPLIFISTESFRSKENLEKMAQLRDAPVGLERAFVYIKGSVHQNHIDAPFVLNYAFLRKIMGMQSETCPEVVIDLNNKLMVQFILKHLGAEADAEIDSDVEKRKDLIQDLFMANGEESVVITEGEKKEEKITNGNNNT